MNASPVQTGRKRRTAPLLEVQQPQEALPDPKGLFSRVVGHVRAVDGVSFHIGPGETLGLVGESGCGKSTVGRTILKLLEPTGGTSASTARTSPASMRRRCCPTASDADIYQDPYASLNPRMSAGEIVGEPLVIHGVGAARSSASALRMLFERVGLRPELMHSFPHEFSGGQRQRIGIARALALNPELIVGDEPVSALDVSIQAQIINLLMELQDEYKLSYLFVAHDLAVVEHISHRVAVMYLGRIVEMTDKVQAVRDAPASLHRGAAVGGADPQGEGAAAQARDPQGRCSEPHQPAGRLPLPHALSLRACALPHRAAGIAEVRAATLGRLPPARRGPHRSPWRGRRAQRDRRRQRARPAVQRRHDARPAIGAGLPFACRRHRTP